MWFSLSCWRFSCDIHALFALSSFSLGFYFSAQLCLHFHHLSPLALYFISVICVVTFLIFFFPFFFLCLWELPTVERLERKIFQLKFISEAFLLSLFKDTEI